MLLHIPEVLAPDQWRALRAELDAADWVDGRRTVGPQGAVVKQNRQLAENSPLAQRWGQVIVEALARHPLYFPAALPLRTVPPLFNRYEGGEHYGFHVDGSVRAQPGGGMLRTDLSCTLFLAEPDEYDGGELLIDDTYGQHEVKLPAGDLVLYPSSSLHCVAPVTRGARVASFFWVQSMVRDDSRRATLFELDRTIQQLRTRLGDSEEVVALTSHYHNLLRQWAEV
ncbi:PKHD-type hydroxylase YbiX [Chitiniphilus shinanonensis]|uniref:PKHD-type hydroxylase YbiX n=1 Tax=Chitiniphilus shinanonensis TaxID=553088 RepID=A0ABQ6BYQ5_9NEIS|nr:Fe2+-dependent dioxygenase [Chitiniphilus shinanonensis]GLS06275.1 PKHD-type hydroxylase YbiX [Chitiniphilus shinanonensis]